MIVAGVTVGAIVLAAVLFSVFFTRDSVSDARRAEGQHLMGTARDTLRVHFGKTGERPKRLSDVLHLEDFRGDYYVVDDELIEISDESATISCTPLVDPKDGRGFLQFEWKNGNASVRWD